MNRVKVFGAGSIGNHLAHAARLLGWDVVVCDVDPAALRRMRERLYPERYGAWDDGIVLCHNDEAPAGGFDLIAVGTPPGSHLPLALASLDEGPGAILIEKPLCTPSLDLAHEFHQRAADSDTHVFVGYDHVVGAATEHVEGLLSDGIVGEIKTIDVEFREHWGGIFAAHFWLNRPADSYLGSWKEGGGASGEHSHAINLWQHFAHVVRAGRVEEVGAMLNYVTQDGEEYDDRCFLHLRTESGLTGRVVQDVISRPHSKRARLQGAEGAIEWVCGYDSAGDAVLIHRPNHPPDVVGFPKKRPDDFVRELQHITRFAGSSNGDSPISLARGLDTMLVVAGAHVSSRTGRAMRIDYAKGYTSAALDARTVSRV